MITKNADLGEKFLLSHEDTYKLETEYDFDGERVFIQLKNNDNGDCTVFDGSDIFRQVYEFIKGSTGQQEKQYRLSMNGEDFTGTAEDVARWYCKHKNIKLYIEAEDESKDSPIILWALFQNNDKGTLISYFEENDEKDIESGYRLFFNDYMLQLDDAGYRIAELS